MLDVFNKRQLQRRFGLHRIRTKTYATIAMVFLIGLVVIAFFTAILFAWYAKDLPRPDRVSRTDGLSTVILDRNGETLYDIYQNQNRLPVKFDEIPEYLKKATIAVEDKDFYKHQGLSPMGILRGFTACFFLRRCQGGSTLTQQLVKNVLLTNERSIARKIKEAILSIQIERKYKKDDILMYLNEAPYGGTAVGVESASQLYFAKPAHDLSLVESAILAGLPQSPGQYSPFTGTPKAYVWRTQQVLRRMREDGYITATQETEVIKQLDTIIFANDSGSLRAPHFVAYVKDQLVEKFGTQVVEGGGLKVTTTVDWKLQEKAQTIVKEEVVKAKTLKVSNGAAVVIDPKTGEILAMVGSKDYTATDSSGYKFNVAVQGLRQPGSAIKPITYAAAFKKGYTPSTLLLDVDTKYPSGDSAKPDYNPKNYDGKYRGPMQLRYALANSINTIAVKVNALVGVKDILKLGYDMGLTSFEPTDEMIKRVGLSLTLGGGEVSLLDLTSAFGVFAINGQRSDPVSVLKVVDSKGKILFEHKPIASRPVLDSGIAYLVSDILSDNDARKEIFGTKSYLVVSGHTVAVKTGTTDDKRDNWTVGYTPSVVVGTWVGNNDNSPMNPALASGVTGAAPIWNRIISEFLKNKKDESFIRPDSVTETEIDGYGGGLPVEGQARRKERFVRGTEPTTVSSIYKNIKVSRKDGNKLANSVEIAKGEYDTKQYIVFTEADPISTDGKNRWQDGINPWVATLTDSKFHPPTEIYQGSGDIVVSIKEPQDTNQVGNSFTIKIEAATNNGSITKIELYVDGIRIKEYSDPKVSDTITLDSGPYRTVMAKATDSNGKTSDTTIHVGVNQAYATPSPTTTPTLTPAPTP
jgi:1A family penicillin-binding protein